MLWILRVSRPLATTTTIANVRIEATENDVPFAFSSSDTVNTSLTILNATTPSPLNAQAQNLDVLIGLVGRSINLNTIILVLLATIHDAAQYRATSVIPAQYRIGLHGYTALIAVTPEPRITAPFPEYEWLIRSLAQLPDYMLKNRKFSEANVLVKVDGVGVIDASLVDVGSGPSSLNALDVETA